MRDSIQGHWDRRWIRAPGFEDKTTRVHWIQVGEVYADVRIPSERPDLTGYRALAEVPADLLFELARAEGFAGKVELDGTCCTWHRDINWHGTPETLDVGEISFDDEGRMIERGVLADYTELWEQRATAAAGRAYRASGESFEAYLVTRDRRFVLGIGRPDKPSTSQMLEALKDGNAEVGTADAFEGIHAVGRMVDASGVAELATDPLAEGRAVVTLENDQLIWHRIGFDGAEDEVEMQIQEIVVAAGPP